MSHLETCKILSRQYCISNANPFGWNVYVKQQMKNSTLSPFVYSTTTNDSWKELIEKFDFRNRFAFALGVYRIMFVQ